MKVLVACEFSGIVREAFRAKGHDAWSCDLLPTEIFGPHIQSDVLKVLDRGWDLMIAHPPCTYLTVTANRWRVGNELNCKLAIDFVINLMNAPIPKIALENPVGVLSTEYRPPDQIIQPWQFGHGESKRTCFWLKNLPWLWPTKLIKTRNDSFHMMPESKDRWKNRSRTLKGIASAMAEQWGKS